MKRLFLLLTLLALPAFSQPFGGVIVSSNNLPAPTYQTYGAMTLYVDPTGSDANSCIGSGAAACATLQGAFNKIPKLVRHTVAVNVAAGSYTGVQVYDFQFAPLNPTTGAYINVVGTYVNATLGSGTPTGTTTSATGSIASAFGTLTDTAQAWTVNGLNGYLLEITSGTQSGVVRPIISNTATTVTVAGSFTAPAAGSTYAIQNTGSNITTLVNQPALPNTASGTPTGIYISGNGASRAGSSGLGITFDKIGVNTSIASSAAVFVGGGSNSFSFRRGRISNSGAAGNGFVFRGTGFAYLDASHIVTTSTSATAVQILGVGSTSALNTADFIVSNNFLEAASTGTTAAPLVVGGFGGGVTSNQVSNTNAASTGAAMLVRNAWSAGVLNQNQMTCASATGLGAHIPFNTITYGASAVAAINNIITGCGTALSISGFASWTEGGSVSTLTGAITGVSASFGARARILTAATVTGGTQDYLYDGVAITNAALILLVPKTVTNANYATWITKE